MSELRRSDLQATETPEQTVARLAAVPCPPAGTGHDDTCTTCRGTGLRWPGLSQPKRCHHRYIGIPDDYSGEWDFSDPDWDAGAYGEDGASSCNCNRTGYAGQERVSVAEAVLWALKRRMDLQPTADLEWRARHIAEDIWNKRYTLEAAVLAALEASQ